MKNTFLTDSASLTQSPSKKSYIKADSYKENIVSKTSSQKPSKLIENVSIRHSGEENAQIDYDRDKSHKSQIRRRIKEILSK